MCAVFGIGSMIYSGLSMGQYFEMPPLDECTNILVVVTPGLRLAFTFVQMYFIFLNASVSTTPVTTHACFLIRHLFVMTAVCRLVLKAGVVVCLSDRCV